MEPVFSTFLCGVGECLHHVKSFQGVAIFALLLSCPIRYPAQMSMDERVNTLNSPLTGTSQGHLVEIEHGHFAHLAAAEDLQSLVGLAKQAGFDLRICSSFRSFDQQVKIWNEKATGKRAVFDDQGNPIDILTLDERQRVFKILRWSALPGASRHHWGSDFDVYDAAAVPIDYKLQLKVSEYSARGPFAPMKSWLDENAARFGFFFPYSVDQGGVHPEPWHISHRKTATRLLWNYTFQVLVDHLQVVDFALIDVVRREAETIYHDFVINTSS